MEVIIELFLRLEEFLYGSYYGTISQTRGILFMIILACTGVTSDIHLYFYQVGVII